MHGFTSYGQRWDYCDGIPVAAAHYFKDEGDLFKVPVYSCYDPRRDQRKKGEQRKKHATVAGAKAVDEDLYKIPPDQLLCHRMPKRKRVLVNFLSGCLGLSCIA